MNTHRAIQHVFLYFLAVTFVATFRVEAQTSEVATSEEPFDVRALVLLLSADPVEREESFELLEAHWQPSFVPMVLEVSRFVRDPKGSRKLQWILEKKTSKRFGLPHPRQAYDAWLEWWWNVEGAQEHPDYAAFKSTLYGVIDPRFRAYFDPARESTIRLDEVQWGGVVQDGIPPLRGPKMISAAEASYLKDDHVVFGLEIEGDARAYPKRILAWHEMFVDEVGGVPVAGVYCTLCGSMILYETVYEGVPHDLGTSGFLYRSNKLMYDRATQSLWNTLWGRPVIGPLVGKGIELNRRSIVTSTWGEWRRRHPQTKVLSLDTGHDRDYGEGVAYRDYFATDELMFTVPKTDSRLKNKAEVLALLLREHPEQPLAIASRFLVKNPLHHEQIEDLPLVVLTDGSGAHRAFATEGRRFTAWDGDRMVRDTEGTVWTLSEDALTAADGRTLRRLPAHRAFWFGWVAAWPETRLVK